MPASPIYSDNDTAATAAGGSFAETRWSLVLLAATDGTDRGRAALNTLCAAYWPAMFAYFRRSGLAPADAEDAVQEFLLQLIERRTLASADPTRGRFRSFLLTCLKRFAINDHRRSSTQKRGGGLEAVALDSLSHRARQALEPRTNETPERHFDRVWAGSLMTRVLERLKEACAEEGGDRLRRFDVLKPWLTDECSEGAAAAAAVRLGTTPAGVRSAIHRMRMRFRSLFRDEVSRTMNDDDSVDDEIRYLASVL